MNLKQRRKTKAWVDALRSGDYKQTRGQLVEVEYDDEDDKAVRTAFCCLAVLADLGQTTWDGGWTPRTREGRRISRTDTDMLDEAWFLEATGLRSFDSDPNYDGGSEGSFQTKLAEFNDDGRSFKQIANSIVARANKVHPGWDVGL